MLVPDLSVDEVRWPVFAGTAQTEGLAAGDVLGRRIPLDLLAG